MIGEYAALAAALGWAFTSVLTKPITHRLRASSILATYLWMTTLLTIVVALATGRLDDAFRLPATTTAFFIAGAVVGASGDLLLIRAFALGSVSYAVTVATSLFIFFTALGGALFLGEVLTAQEAVGGGIILTGVLLSNVRKGIGSVSPRGLRPRDWLRTSPLALSIITAVLWATSLLLWDIGVSDADPVSASAIANLAPGVIFLALAMFVPAVRPVTRYKGDTAKLLTAGLLYAAGVLSAMFALDSSSASLTAILISSTPIFVVPLGAIFLKERFPRQTLLGMSFCMVGVAVVLV